MKKIFIFFVLSVFMLFGFSPEQTENLDVNLKKLPNKIELSWSDIKQAHNYVIYSNETLLYSGDKNKFKHENLKEGDYLEYDIFALNSNGEILTNNHIKTSVVHPKHRSTIGIDIISSSNSVKIDWYDLSNATSYLISVDDGELQTVTKSELLLQNLSDSKEYSTLIFAEDQSNKTKSEEEQKGDHYISLPVQTTPEYTGTSLENYLSDKGNGLSAKAVGNVSTIKHRTFISPNPFTFTFSNTTLQCGKGDGRGFSATAGTSRTEVYTSVDWDTLESGFSKYVYPSVMYNSKCELSSADSKTSSSSGIGLGTKYINASEAGFHVTHRAKSPHSLFGLPLPDIYYYYDLTIAKNGATYMYGSHDQFPWHEIYRQNKGGSWASLYTFAPKKGAGDAWKLLGAWPNKSIDVRDHK